jgi:hypothetical protein
MSTNDDPASYAVTLTAMTDDEVFAEMQTLERKSEAGAKNRGQDLEDIIAQIALVEQEIEQRFPGQALAPYKQWQRDQ